MAITEIMDSLLETYTKSEMKIYLLLKKDPHAVEKFTISRIATMSGTSKSAVLRFCQKLGFSGYSEFRFSMTKELHSKNVLQMEDGNLLMNMMEDFMSLTKELGKVEERKILNTVNLIQNANLVRSVGFMNSSLPAQKLMFDFIRMGKNVIFIDNVVMANSSVSTIKADDVIIFFSVSGRIEELTDFIKSVKKRNASIVVITCNERGSLTKVADEVIVLPTTRPGNYYNIDEHAHMIMFINILIEYFKREL